MRRLMDVNTIMQVVFGGSVANGAAGSGHSILLGFAT
jgi:hypothetical protein